MATLKDKTSQLFTKKVEKKCAVTITHHIYLERFKFT